MGKVQTVKYVCDKCGLTVDELSYDDQRKWVQVEQVHGYSADAPLLCPECLGLFREWLEVPVADRQMVDIGGGPYR